MKDNVKDNVKCCIIQKKKEDVGILHHIGSIREEGNDKGNIDAMLCYIICPAKIHAARTKQAMIKDMARMLIIISKAAGLNHSQRNVFIVGQWRFVN